MRGTGQALQVLKRKAGRPKRQPGQLDLREALLDAAHELMISMATIDVSVADIAEKAQANVALVKYHFGGKDGLLLSLAMRSREKIIAGLAELIALDVTAQEKLYIHIWGQIHAYRHQPYLQRLTHKILRDSDEESSRMYATSLVKPLGEFYGSIVKQGIRERSIRDIDPMFLYVAVSGACDLLFSGRASLKYGFDRDELDDATIDNYAHFVTGLVITGVFPLADLTNFRSSYKIDYSLR